MSTTAAAFSRPQRLPPWRLCLAPPSAAESDPVSRGGDRAYGRGNYGHGVDTVWRRCPAPKSSPSPTPIRKDLPRPSSGLASPKGLPTTARCSTRSKPDLVAVGPRWLDQHRDMVVAAAECGGGESTWRSPYAAPWPRPTKWSPPAKRHGVKAAVAHQTRYSPILPVVRQLIDSGTLGRIVEILRPRGKEDSRGGGEDLWVLGTHVMDLIHWAAGPPKWCFATVHHNGRPMRKEDARPGSEGIGPLAGDEVHAMYRLADGTTAYFDSIRNAGGDPTRFRHHGLRLPRHRATRRRLPAPRPHFLPDSSWSPGQTGKTGPNHLCRPRQTGTVARRRPGRRQHFLAVKDLISAIEQNRQPLSSIDDARIATEMIVAVFASHVSNSPVTIPLSNRENPLSST